MSSIVSSLALFVSVIVSVWHKAFRHLCLSSLEKQRTNTARRFSRIFSNINSLLLESDRRLEDERAGLSVSLKVKSSSGSGLFNSPVGFQKRPSSYALSFISTLLVCRYIRNTNSVPADIGLVRLETRQNTSVPLSSPMSVDSQ